MRWRGHGSTQRPSGGERKKTIGFRLFLLCRDEECIAIDIGYGERISGGEGGGKKRRTPPMLTSPESFISNFFMTKVTS
jgi:hypothetical protein